MHGGEQGLHSVMKEAKQNKIKVIVDSVARVSSSRLHHKYRHLLLNYLNGEGTRKICYGTDGLQHNFKDSAMLNYRKLESWELMVSEIVSYTQKYGFDGIHCDNGQAWPQIMELDIEELKRKEADGTPAYSCEDIMNGEIVKRNENYGFWNSNNMEHYHNPFFVKLCRSLWEAFPNFMIVAEAWGGYMFENRQIILTRSGVIPRLFKLPPAICSVFGMKLHKDGRLSNSKKSDVLAIKRWYETSRQFLPEGAILLQSSTAHSWPYPAYLYGKATWAAVDILYFMPDIPITFMGEIEGEVFRIATASVF